MGQKVNPTGFRVGIKIRTGDQRKKTVEEWRSQWYARKQDFGRMLVEDQKIRRFIKHDNRHARIPRIDIERTGDGITVLIHTAKPALLIGRKGVKIERLKDELNMLLGRLINDVRILEVKNPDLEAQLISESIAEQLEKRASFRRVMKKHLEVAENAGAKGVKIMISGRLGGAEIAKCEHTSTGKIPLQTLRANVDYGFTEASTSYGNIGIKVWVYKGEILSEDEEKKQST
ncbi:MAG: 30S ribosomal protein S3 [Planctomycetota bacterium]|jgi:small subunit ribosomal protein S3